MVKKELLINAWKRKGYSEEWIKQKLQSLGFDNNMETPESEPEPVREESHRVETSSNPNWRPQKNRISFLPTPNNEKMLQRHPNKSWLINKALTKFREKENDR